MELQALFQKALKFAAFKHTEAGQTVPGTNLPYIVHLRNVAMEVLVAAQHTPNFNLELAVQVALLQDTLEDTTTTPDELVKLFGQEVTQGIMALTKEKFLSKEQQVEDYLRHFKQQPVRSGLLNLLIGLQPSSLPRVLGNKKRIWYHQEARIILHD